MLLVDTNIWLAAADRRSDRHDDCAQVLLDRRRELASTVPVIAETAWLILDRLGPSAQTQFLRTITSGHLEALELHDEDWQRCVELVERYADLSLDLMDASLVAAAGRLRITTIATLKHRDFRVVRPRHIESFALIPSSAGRRPASFSQRPDALQGPPTVSGV